MSRKLVVEIDLDQCGYRPNQGWTREEAVEEVRNAFFFTPLSFHILPEDE